MRIKQKVYGINESYKHLAYDFVEVFSIHHTSKLNVEEHITATNVIVSTRPKGSSYLGHSDFTACDLYRYLVEGLHIEDRKYFIRVQKYASILYVR